MKKTFFKYILIFGALLAGFSSCVKEQLRDPEGDIPYPTEGKAVVEFTVAVPGAATKSMADLPSISTMRVVVFGSSGFLKESVSIDNFTSATTNGDETLYTFKAQLSLTDSKNLRIHVIANCENIFPWKYEPEVMSGSAYTSGTQDAYWARFILANGVTLEKEWDDASQSMVYVKDADGYYKVTDDVTDAFCGGSGRPGLPLIRNFAKVSVESKTPQLVLNTTTTMAVINRPDRGSVAPYNSATDQYIMDYKDHDYSWFKDNYNGFSPTSVQWVDTDPDAVTFSPCTVDGSGKVNGGVFMYERPRPSALDVPSYIIVHGIYYPLKEGVYREDLPSNWKTLEESTPGTYLDLSKGTDCYYKIDFMDDDGYYAIFRNFRYHIRITNVAKVGADTPGAAGSTGGTGDISQDANVSGLTDISDGYGRIAVSYMGWTFVERQAMFELKYKFITDASLGDAAIDNSLESEGGPVTVIIGEKTGDVTVFDSTLDASISSATGVEIGSDVLGRMKVIGTANNNNDTEGFRTIRFTVNTPSATDKTTQTVRIQGQIDEHRTIYRDVLFYLMSRQDMIVECVADEPNSDYADDYVEAVSGAGVNVNITIPKLLPESMFPLVFSLESDELSITPNTAKYPQDNLPVESGYSICTGKTSTKSFHYVRTLSYSEYETLEETLNGMLLTCHFKTNKADNASTIYVDNQYFNKNSDPFYNYSMFNFRNLGFSDYRAAANTNIQFNFSLDADDTERPRSIEVVLDGLVPQDGSELTVVDADEGIYSYTVIGGSSNVSLALKTMTARQGFDGTYTVTLRSYETGGTKAIYHEAELYNMAYNLATLTPSGTNGNWGSRTLSSGTVRAVFAQGRNQSTYIRARSGYGITISTTDSKEIVGVILHYINGYSGGTVTADTGSYSLSGMTGTWSGSATSIVLTPSSEARITSIEVLYKP